MKRIFTTFALCSILSCFAGGEVYTFDLSKIPDFKKNAAGNYEWSIPTDKNDTEVVINLDELSEYVARERGDQRRGSRASRSESPSVFNVRTSMKSSPEAAVISHHTPAHNRC